MGGRKLAMDNQLIFRSSAKYSEKGMVPRAREILKRLWDIKIDDMNENELEGLEKIMSHGIACIKREVDKRRGYQKKEVSSEMGSDMLIRDLVFDHVRSTYLEDGDVFVNEPYSLSNENIMSMATAIKEGYDVFIDGNSQYYPGKTVRVLIRKKVSNELYDLVWRGKL